MAENEEIEACKKLIETLQELNKYALEVKSKCDGFKKYVDKADEHINEALKRIESAEKNIIDAESINKKTIEDLTSKHTKEIKELLQDMSSIVQRAENLQKTFGVSVNKIQEVNDKLIQQDKNYNKLEAQVNDLNIKIVELSSVVEFNKRSNKPFRSSLQYKNNPWNRK